LERIVNHRELGTDPVVEPIMTSDTLDQILGLVRRIFLPTPVANYIARLVDATHAGQSTAARGIRYGASPRAALSLASAAKARALINERPHASFEDVRFVAGAVLRHRIVLEYNARIEGLTANDLVRSILEEVPFQAHATPRTMVNS
jgi:MoxR-like ATPase